MPAEGNEAIFAAITPRQLDVLCELAEERRHSRLATRLYASVTTVRTHIRVLCELTETHGTDDLWDWWRENRDAYVEWVARRALGDR